MIFISKFLYACNNDWHDSCRSCIMNIVLANIYFEYIMLKFVNSNAHVQHLLLMNIVFYDNMIDVSIFFSKAL